MLKMSKCQKLSHYWTRRRTQILVNSIRPLIFAEVFLNHLEDAHHCQSGLKTSFLKIMNSELDADVASATSAKLTKGSWTGNCSREIGGLEM